MSYILDALKRADAERESTVVPGLHARQNGGAVFATVSRRLRWTQLALAVLSVLLLLAMSAVGWHFWTLNGGIAAVKVADQTAPIEAVSAPMAERTPFAVLSKGKQEVLVLPAVLQPAAIAPAIAPVVAPTLAKPAQRPASQAIVPAALPAVVPVKPLASGAEAIPRLAELTDAIRRQIPLLTINGVAYSESAREKVLLVNDQILSPGGQLTPDIRLEEIGENTVTFSLRGQYFRIDR